MTILQGDIKIMQAQANVDTDNGGGLITANEVVDGLSNNLFKDVSDLDRVYGRVSLRKVFPSVFTDNTDSYLGAHLIVATPPTDPKVKVCIFTTKNWSDKRTSAQGNIESYLVQGPKMAGFLLGTQVAGQRAIQVGINNTDPIPSAGQAVVLVGSGTSNPDTQFVRITQISSAIRTFTYTAGTQQITVTFPVLTLTLSEPLLYTFNGPDVGTWFTIGDTGRATWRDTSVADAASYHTAAKLDQAAALNDATVMVDDIFTNLVPSAQSETPLVNLSAAGLATLYVQAGAGNITVTANTNTLSANNVYLGSPVLPSSLSFTLFGSSVVDSGGDLKVGATTIGSIEYDKGLLIFNTVAPKGTGSVTYTFTPAAVPSKSSLTSYFPITQANRGFNYVTTFLPKPAIGSMIVSYITQGKVYYLFDKGNGIIKGSDTSFGSGTVDYSTGTVVVTLGALPDVGTDILYVWGSPTTTFNRSGSAISPLSVKLVGFPQMAATTVSISWIYGGVTKLVSDDGQGNLTGDGTGTINYATGDIVLFPNNLPSKNTEFSISCFTGAALLSITNLTGSSGAYAGSIGNTDPILHGTVSVVVYLNDPATGVTAIKTLVDKPTSGSSGNLVVANNSSVVVGTIDYNSGAVTITPTLNVIGAVPAYLQRTFISKASA